MEKRLPWWLKRVKRLPTMRETQVQSLGREDLLEKEMATHSSILAWEIPWMEEPGGLQSMGSRRVRHDWVTSLSLSMEKQMGKLGKKPTTNSIPSVASPPQLSLPLFTFLSIHRWLRTSANSAPGPEASAQSCGFGDSGVPGTSNWIPEASILWEAGSDPA